MPKQNAYYSPGDAVRLMGHGQLTEYGRIVATWWNPEIEVYDCYIAFFGSKPPAEIEPPKPYVLRYAEGSLTEGW